MTTTGGATKMGKMSCPREEDQYVSGKLCCDRCPAGTYVKVDCKSGAKTQCSRCEHGRFTAAKNYLRECLKCKECSSSSKMRKVKDCTAEEDTVCECMTGLYCNSANCEHCRFITHCPAGKGVSVQATRTTDTTCVPCAKGTYSNVSDSSSPCKTHTRCEDLGRVLKTAGTSKTDAICGDVKSYCPSILPAGLWSGFVLTTLVVFGLMCWRARRRSYRAANPDLPAALFETVLAPRISPPVQPIPTAEQNHQRQDSCTVETHKLPLFTDINAISGSTEDSVDSSLPITPLKASLSFADSKHFNGSAGHHAANLLLSHPEPQEDEWCET